MKAKKRENCQDTRGITAGGIVIDGRLLSINTGGVQLAHVARRTGGKLPDSQEPVEEEEEED